MGLQIFANLAKICFCQRFFYRIYFVDFQIFANLAKICKGRNAALTLPLEMPGMSPPVPLVGGILKL